MKLKTVSSKSSPPKIGILWHWLGKCILYFMGWKIDGKLPNCSKFILIGGPHTSNWDFVIGMSAVFSYGLKISWIGKHTLFFWPYGWFMKWLGGIPVDRRKPQGYVAQLSHIIERKEKVVFTLAPAGSRKKSNHWKSGFYQMALATGLPLAVGKLDYKTKRANIGNLYYCTGDVKRDMDFIRKAFQGVQGKFLKEMTPIKLRRETEKEDAQ